jgi:hypothetical protein
MTLRNSTRSFSKYLLAGLLAGRYSLKLWGSTVLGFRLCIARGASLFEVGPEFTRQKDALAYGESNYLLTAEKLVMPKKLAA